MKKPVVKIKRVWYFDVGNKFYGFSLKKVFGEWCLRIGLGFCDFGYVFSIGYEVCK